MSWNVTCLKITSLVKLKAEGWNSEKPLGFWAVLHSALRCSTCAQSPGWTLRLWREATFTWFAVWHFCGHMTYIFMFVIHVPAVCPGSSLCSSTWRLCKRVARPSSRTVKCQRISGIQSNTMVKHPHCSRWLHVPGKGLGKQLMFWCIFVHDRWIFVPYSQTFMTDGDLYRTAKRLWQIEICTVQPNVYDRWRFVPYSQTFMTDGDLYCTAKRLWQREICTVQPNVYDRWRFVPYSQTFMTDGGLYRTAKRLWQMEVCTVQPNVH